jgi:arylsulfatase A-like enzyme
MKLDPQHLTRAIVSRMFRTMYHARRGEAAIKRGAARLTGSPTAQDVRAYESDDDLSRGRAAGGGRRRNILFITVDQQRFDALGVNGGTVARTPVADDLAATGINYSRAHVHNVVCMPSRSTMITGQYPRTHGVIANGIALPEDAPSVAKHLRREAGYRTALIGKAHFEPHLDPMLTFYENRCSAEGWTGPWRGFEHIELATHGPVGGHHYASWLWENHPEYTKGFAGVLTGTGGGDTGAPETTHNRMPRELYHTDWVADRTVAWLDSLPADDPWFCWMSFPDPHHPFDPPYGEVESRIDWRDLDLPPGHPGSRERIEAILADKPRHWLEWYRGKVLAHLRANGIDEHTDVFYTSDHGELQGDYGLMFKGPYHVESLLRIPMIWRPAPSAGVDAAVVTDPVGHVDLAPTFCAVAGVDIPEWMEGGALPDGPGSGRERVLTTFDSQFSKVGMHLRTIYRDGWLCTAYRPRTTDEGGRFRLYWSLWGQGTTVPDYDGTEGELYDCRDDPHQQRNRWNDPSVRAWRNELLDDIGVHLRPARQPPLPVSAPT